MKLLAAIDNSAAARPVLQVVKVLAEVLSTPAEAVHVVEGTAHTAEALAEAADVPLTLLHGEPVETIVAAMAADDVSMGVLGARGNALGRRPGHTARAVVAQTSKPVVVLPAQAWGAVQGIGRVLVPLDGTPANVAAVQDAIRVFSGSGIDVVALHVFDAETVPMFWDRPEYEPDIWSREFLARYCLGSSARMTLRTGPTSEEVLDLAESERVDLITLAWSRDLSPGKADVVREVLAKGRVPVLLLPAAPQPHGQLPAVAVRERLRAASPLKI